MRIANRWLLLSNVHLLASWCEKVFHISHTFYHTSHFSLNCILFCGIAYVTVQINKWFISNKKSLTFSYLSPFSRYVDYVVKNTRADGNCRYIAKYYCLNDEWISKNTTGSIFICIDSIFIARRYNNFLSLSELQKWNLHKCERSTIIEQ